MDLPTYRLTLPPLYHKEAYNLYRSNKLEDLREQFLLLSKCYHLNKNMRHFDCKKGRLRTYMYSKFQLDPSV